MGDDRLDLNANYYRNGGWFRSRQNVGVGSGIAPISGKPSQTTPPMLN